MKAHPWFSGFDWDLLASQKLEAPDPPELEAVHIHIRLLPENLRGLVRGSKSSALYNGSVEEEV